MLHPINRSICRPAAYQGIYECSAVLSCLCQAAGGATPVLLAACQTSPLQASFGAMDNAVLQTAGAHAEGPSGLNIRQTKKIPAACDYAVFHTVEVPWTNGSLRLSMVWRAMVVAERRKAVTGIGPRLEAPCFELAEQKADNDDWKLVRERSGHALEFHQDPYARPFRRGALLNAMPNCASQAMMAQRSAAPHHQESPQLL